MSSQLSLPMFYIVLAVVAEQRHGYEIMKTVEEQSGGKVRIGAGTLYGAIKRLLEDGYIAESDGDARRRYYRATPKGGQMVTSELDRYSQVLAASRRSGIYPAAV